MIVTGRVKKGAYFDSVTLMTVRSEVTALAGVADAAVVMGSPENREILADSGLMVNEFASAGATDLLIAVKAESDEMAARAFAAVDERLQQVRSRPGQKAEALPASCAGALQVLPDANLALISVAGRYAGAEAMRALQQGLHVMLFSDNVPMSVEIELKREARRRDLLVMGPDCGTAIIGGAPLGFANVVPRGPVGIVGASGTGMQEICSILANRGVGISHAIGTGSRDVTSEVGGMTFLAGIAALAADDRTEAIVLVSKPPAPDVHARLAGAIEKLTKPVVAIMLGSERMLTAGVTNLEEAAFGVMMLLGGQPPGGGRELLAERDEDTVALARDAAGRLEPKRKYLRGLMSGGTFAVEAQLVVAGLPDGLYSNVPAGGAEMLPDARLSCKNTIVDLGADQFTVGRPHPMIDYSLRCERILREAQEEQTAVILLDVVLGYGAHPDPVAALSDVIRAAAAQACVVCSVCGTDRDPQNRSLVVAGLQKAGAIVMSSNAATSRLAGEIVRIQGGK